MRTSLRDGLIRLMDGSAERREVVEGAILQPYTLRGEDHTLPRKSFTSFHIAGDDKRQVHHLAGEVLIPPDESEPVKHIELSPRTAEEHDSIEECLPPPDVARQIRPRRIKRLLSDADIAAVTALIDSGQFRWQRPHPEAGRRTMYLNEDGGFRKALPKVLEKILKAVADTDAKAGWGLLRARTVRPRCVEYHSLQPGKDVLYPKHYDYGSVVTIDVMLNHPGKDFVGGDFLTTEENGTATRHRPFDRGDAMLFVSHKPHHVSPVESGDRRCLVIELWEGDEKTCAHRCNVRRGPCLHSGAPARLVQDFHAGRVEWPMHSPRKPVYPPPRAQVQEALMDLALDSEPPANHDLMMWAPTVSYNPNLLEPRRAAIIEWEPVEGAVTFELQWRCVPPTDPPGNPGPDAEWTSTAKSRALTGNRTIKLLATEVSGFPAGHRVAFRVRACTAANRWGPFSPASIDIKTPAADRPVEQSSVARRAKAALLAAAPPSAEDVAAAGDAAVAAATKWKQRNADRALANASATPLRHLANAEQTLATASLSKPT